jgi:hypothetical protein
MQEPEHRHDVTVEVFVPKEPDKHRRFTWPLSLTVGEAAIQAAAALGYAGPNLTLARARTVFAPAGTLRAAKIDNGDKVDLVSAGGGV